MAAGELKKLKIYAYNNPELSTQHQVGEPFTVLINPETYSLETKMEFRQAQGQGTTGNQQPFELKAPEELSFEFLFDNTGIIDGKPTENIAQALDSFYHFLMDYDGSTHEPKFFKLVWGTLLFKGRCTSLAINYKLFNPDGAPIRATCKTTFKEFNEENLRVAEEDAQSPDLTHYRQVKVGDTLPLMCYHIYGDSRYYLQVAKVNKLNNYRKLAPGQEIFFPPVVNNK